MRILQLGKFYPIVGGVEKVMWDLAGGLVSRGVHCDMLCACLKEDLPREKGRYGLHELPFAGPGDGPCGSLLCAPAVTKVAATMISPRMILTLRRMARDYDIIHVHHPDPMACLALWLSGYRGKVVLHWHSDILRQKTLLRFYKPLQSWLIRRADLILGTSPVYVGESEALKDVQDKVSYLPIGILPVPEVPEERIAAVKSRFAGKKIIYSLGRLVGYKGYEYLVDAAALLPEDCVVVIGGCGPLEETLKQRIAAGNLEGRVFLVGRVPDGEKAVWYRASDLFCLSSVWKTEAFAIVQVEAMSCGKPVVATRIPGSGVSWVNADGVSGLNVPVEDAGALADAIMRILGDGELYRNLSAGARRRFEEEFTYPAMLDRCMAYYEKMIDNI